MSLLSSIRAIPLSGLLDIFLVSLLIYTILVWFKRTRAASVFTGMVIASGLYLLTRAFNLTLTSELFEKFFAILIVALVVIFQEELRYLFERIAEWSLRGRFLNRRPRLVTRRESHVLVHVAMDLARERIGALIVLRGRDLIQRHLMGGVELDGAISDPLLKSLFDPHSIGHDGALILEGGRVTHFSCRLPLSKNLRELGVGGTRHAAAVGLSELSDAMCLVVSEERGVVSLARRGKLEPVADAEALGLALERFYEEVSPRPAARPWTDFFRKNWMERVLALTLGVGVWFVFDHGAQPMYRTIAVPVSAAGVPPGWRVADIQPKEVDVTLQGPRRAFYFLKVGEVRLSVRPKAREGQQTVLLSSRHFFLPGHVDLETVEPKRIRVRVEKIPAPDTP